MDSQSSGRSPVATDEVVAPPRLSLDIRSRGSFRAGGEPSSDRARGFRAPDPVPDPPAGEPAAAPPVSAPAHRVGLRWALTAAVVAVVAVAAVALLAFRLGAASPSPTAASAQPSASPSASAPSTLAVTDVYQQLAPSVVLITTSKGSLGSGVVVTDAGTILTANHVISGGGTLTVTFTDGTKSTATVASADPTTDIATLTPATLPEVVVPATLGGSVAVGADVVAIGNPLGLRLSTTSGVVSGLNRSEKTDAGQLTGLIQFDAAVNPGSSGGPLLDDQGSVIGIVVSIVNPGKEDAFAGIGFAVPIGSAVGGGSGDGPGRGPQI